MHPEPKTYYYFSQWQERKRIRLLPLDRECNTREMLLSLPRAQRICGEREREGGEGRHVSIAVGESEGKLCGGGVSSRVREIKQAREKKRERVCVCV